MNELEVRQTVVERMNTLNSRYGTDAVPVFVRWRKHGGHEYPLTTSNGQTVPVSNEKISELRTAGAFYVHPSVRKPDRNKIYFFDKVLKEFSKKFVKSTVDHEYNHYMAKKRDLDLNLKEMELYAYRWQSGGL